ncbi:unnamed protein product [Camellia sinensis]
MLTVLKVFPYPITITSVQFAVGTILVLFMWTSNLCRRPKISGAQLVAILPLAVVHTSGNLFTNNSIGKVAISFTHTIKAMEPFFSVIPTLWVVASLLPIVGGVGLASMTEASFNWPGFWSAMASNLTNQSRNVLSKTFMVKKEESLDNITLFSIRTIMSFFLLTPFTLLQEAPLPAPSSTKVVDFEVLDIHKILDGEKPKKPSSEETTVAPVEGSDRKFLYQILGEVINAGATTVNVPDTVGYTVPDEFGQLIADIKANTPGIENVIISTHCHNDLGLSTANTLAVCSRQVEVTINGIGERAGNASLEEVESTIDIWGMGSLWTIAVVILVNMHLAMDIKRWLLLTHSLVWGSIIITYACVVGIGFYTHLPQLRDNIPSGKVTCILALRLDIQIAREAEILRKEPNYFGSKPDPEEQQQ